jgi:hypothetical protein
MLFFRGLNKVVYSTSYLTLDEFAVTESQSVWGLVTKYFKVSPH